MNINEKLYVAGIGLIFLTVVIGGVLIWQVMMIWLKNKREQRRWDGFQREQDRVDRNERERVEWYKTAKAQLDQIERMVATVNELSANCKKAEQDYERAKERMSKFNMKGEAL